MPAPKIDKRSYDDIASQTSELAKRYSDWTPREDGQLDAGSALIGIFGRFMELIVDRLNQVPEKNYLAFLNLIGADLLPPQPARVPLTFFPAAGTGEDTFIRVPAGTQAAAPPPQGEEEEIIFETERDLVLTTARLTSVVVIQPSQDSPGKGCYADYTAQAVGRVDEAFAAFCGEPCKSIGYHLYLAKDDLFAAVGGAGSKTVALSEIREGLNASQPVQWWYWNGNKWVKLDEQGGDPKPIKEPIKIEDPASPSACTLAGTEATWLRASSETPLWPDVELPNMQNIKATLKVEAHDLPPDLAFANGVPLDPSRGFYPFGETPRLNDTLYLASREVFAKAGASVTIQVKLSQPGAASKDLEIAWEVWNGRSWEEIGGSRPAEKAESEADPSFSDSTLAFAQSGEVKFKLPQEMGPGTVNGETGYWLRARIVRGNYGTEVEYSVTEETKDGNKVYKPAKTGGFTPPRVESLTVGYEYTEPGADLIACLTYGPSPDDAAAETAFPPFTPQKDTQPTLYLGFDQKFDNRPVSLYVQVEPPEPDKVTRDGQKQVAASKRPLVTWEYASLDGGWRPLGAVDETQGFAGRGLIGFIGPRDFSGRQLFGRELYWVRARSESGEFAVPPRLRRLLLNTTWASQATTIFNETLGSSNGNPGQAFRLAQSPVLSGLCLEVWEPGMPSPEEEAEIKKLEGPDAITTILDAAGHPEEIWVRWQAVPDFHGSGPRDRHYTIDYLTGTIHFGDGRYGLIPPPGQNNIRAARYRSGGGTGGNRPRETVIQLKSSVPYIDRVTNFEEASGGADRQSLDRVKRYGPRQLRHRGRAVTVEDLEDLAYAASAEVARAKAIPASSGDGTKGGAIGLIVVPQSDALQPIPSLGLLEQVKAYLQARCPATAEVWVAGPVWVEVKVTADVVPASLAVADQVEIRLKAALERFLHPLTGGALGKGWPFGRRPHLSDLYAMIESVEGVDHVRALEVDPEPDEKGKPDRTGPFLIYSGQHQITLRMA
jgi:hypothetical protein